jgi:hypothetical protein
MFAIDRSLRHRADLYPFQDALGAATGLAQKRP